MASERPVLSSIRARMTFAFALQTAGLMALIAGGLLFYLHYTAAQAAETTLNTAAARVRNELADIANGGGFHDFLVENGDSLKLEGLSLLLIDAQGRLLQRSQSAGPSWPHQKKDGWRIRVVPYGARKIVIGCYWRSTEAVLKREGAVLLALSLCVVFASAVGAWWLVGRTLSPIDALSHQARRAAGTDSLHLRLLASSQDAEVVDLVATLNALLASIGRTAEARGRFYAAASHELRTPLQALSGHLEVALSRERTREEYKTATAEASRQTQRLTALVQGLLLLNQLDRPMPDSLPREPVDLIDLCRRFLTQFQPLIDRRRLTVSSDLPPVFALTAFPQHTEMLLRNLIENALKYSTAGGCVTLRIGAFAGVDGLELFNTFPQYPRLDTTALFEPFYRPDEARTSDTGGNGLGLAICRAIAAANGWQISLDQTDSGVCVRLLFAHLLP